MIDLQLRCPQCGFEKSVSQTELREKGAAAAANLTDALMAERFREACRIVVRSTFPEAMWRLPLARIDKVPDSVAVELGRHVGSVLLAPP